MKRLVIVFEDEEFERFKKCKESAKELGEAVSWEDYLLKLAKVRR